MEKIILKFCAQSCLNIGSRICVVLTLDESGKHYNIDNDESFALNVVLYGGQVELPKRVTKAFTANAINKILAKDEIPDESGIVILDGNMYEISISKGNIIKEYSANDASIETYPLLRYLASWYRGL